MTDDIETTRRIWTDHYVSQFSLDHMPEEDHIMGYEEQVSVPRYYEITSPQISEVLKKKKGRSSPGPSGIR